MDDLISRAEAIKAMYELEQDDIETYGVKIPEGFDGERAAEALNCLPNLAPIKKFKAMSEALYAYSDYLTKLANKPNMSKYCQDIIDATVVINRAAFALAHPEQMKEEI